MTASRPVQRYVGIALTGLLLIATGCGYHNANTAVRLPSDLHTIYFPGIANASSTYRIGTTFSEAVVRVLRDRTNYRIISKDDGTADATLSGNITNVFLTPLTYDSVTGGITSSMVVVSLNAKLVGKDGKVYWSNPNFTYREQYQESTSAASFFDESGPAIQRVANSFADTLVANILESF